MHKNMVTIMNKEELSAFCDKLAELTEHGTEEDVRAYIDHYYPRLPEDTRKELLFASFFSAVQEEVALREVQEEGLAAAEILESAKKGLNKAKKEGSET